MRKFQVTFFAKKYRPVATIVESSGIASIYAKGAPYKKAIQLICAKRGWSLKDMQEFGYLEFKVREIKPAE